MQLDQIFNEFALVVQENPGYTIGLLNSERKVIASSDDQVIGKAMIDFLDSEHERVYPLQVNGRLRGYLWVQSYTSVEMIGKLLFDSLTTRIQYELSREKTLKGLSRDDQLIQELLKKGSSDVNYIQDLVRQLRLNMSIPRIAVYIFNNNGFDQEEVTNLKYKINDHNTFYSSIDDHSLLIYKNIKPSLEEEPYQTEVAKFVSELVDWGINDVYYAIGTPQYDLRLYEASYSSCVWLMRHVEMQKDHPYYFMDYLMPYYLDKLSEKETDNLFDFYIKSMDKMNSDEMAMIAKAFRANNFNIKQTADRLFLHKNTLLYKLKRFEISFGLDIRGSAQGKLLFCLIADLFDRTLVENRQVKNK